MGASLKYLILFAVIALGALAFQNCGHKLQANGDPYENRDTIHLDDPINTDNGQASGAMIPGFTTSQVCSPSAGGQIGEVRLGQKNGAESVYVQLAADGRFKFYPWADSTIPLILNDTISSTVKIQAISLSDDQVQIQLLVGGAAATEILVCH